MSCRSLLLIILLLQSVTALPQMGWTYCSAPQASSRIDDIYMIDAQTGYAVYSNGIIAKTIDSGKVWTENARFPNTYLRSVEFINERKGFVGGFPNTARLDFILMTTNDSGRTWTDLSSRINPVARKGICGLAIPDSNTIYGCGNWYNTSGYIIKSTDGGNTWSFIDMSAYASSVIDMHFINKDEGFATGRSSDALRTAIILHTTDGGVSWTVRFKNTTPSEYCWKIHRLNNQVYFASVEDLINTTPKILKSTDGGMSWQVKPVQAPVTSNHLQGVGFLNETLGWTGGWTESTYETSDGGNTWKRITACPYMNRVFRVNDSLLFATGSEIWKYGKTVSVVNPPPAVPVAALAYFNAFPNPASKANRLTVRLNLSQSTQVWLALFNEAGVKVMDVDNSFRNYGTYEFNIPTWKFPAGMYTLLLKTHMDKQVQKIIFTH